MPDLMFLLVMMNILTLEKDKKKVKDNIIKHGRNLFNLRKYEAIKDRIIRAISNFLNRRKKIIINQ